MLLSTGKHQRFLKVRLFTVIKFISKEMMNNSMKALLANLLHPRYHVRFLWQILLRSLTIFSVETILLPKSSLTTVSGLNLQNQIVLELQSKLNLWATVKNYKSVKKLAKAFCRLPGRMNQRSTKISRQLGTAIPDTSMSKSLRMAAKHS